MKAKTNEEILKVVNFLKEEMSWLPDFSAFNDDNRPYKTLMKDIVEIMEFVLEGRKLDVEYHPHKDSLLPMYKLNTAIRTKEWTDGLDVVFKDENGEKVYLEDFIQ